MPEKLSFEVVDKSTPDFLTKIGKKELGMLVHMLEDLSHTKAEFTRKAFGYADDPAKWDEAAYEAYKNGTLRNRMAVDEARYARDGGLTNYKNYTFFLLKDEKGETVALASGHAYDDKMQLRLLNVTTARDARGQGHATELMKHIAHWAKEYEFEKIVVPLSKHALEKGNANIYRKLCHAAGLTLQEKPHLNIDEGVEDRSSREMHITPRRFHALALGAEEAQHAVR